MANPQENNLNMSITLTMKEGGAAKDISGAGTRQFIFYKPNSSSQTLSVSFSTTGTDGKLVYTTTAGFLTPAGLWQVQARIVLASSSFDGKSSIAKFVVEPNLP